MFLMQRRTLQQFMNSNPTDNGVVFFFYTLLAIRFTMRRILVLIVLLDIVASFYQDNIKVFLRKESSRILSKTTTTTIEDINKSHDERFFMDESRLVEFNVDTSKKNMPYCGDLPAVKAPLKEFEKMVTDNLITYRKHDIVMGEIVKFGKRGIFIDLKLKAWAYLPREEVHLDPTLNATANLNIGDLITVKVLKDENKLGQLIVSKRRLDFDTAWTKANEAKINRQILDAKVLSTNKGGVMVHVLGLNAFLPSGFSVDTLDESCLGMPLRVRVIQVERELGQLVVSTRHAASERIKSLFIGQILTGRVTVIKDYGLFLNFEGLSGLLHRSQVSQKEVRDMNLYFKVNDVVTCAVFTIEHDLSKFGVSTRVLEMYPGDMLTDPQKVYLHAEETAKRTSQTTQPVQNSFVRTSQTTQPPPTSPSQNSFVRTSQTTQPVQNSFVRTSQKTQPVQNSFVRTSQTTQPVQNSFFRTSQKTQRPASGIPLRSKSEPKSPIKHLENLEEELLSCVAPPPPEETTGTDTIKRIFKMNIDPQTSLSSKPELCSFMKLNQNKPLFNYPQTSSTKFKTTKKDITKTIINDSILLNALKSEDHHVKVEEQDSIYHHHVKVENNIQNQQNNKYKAYLEELERKAMSNPKVKLSSSSSASPLSPSSVKENVPENAQQEDDVNQGNKSILQSIVGFFGRKRHPK